jgi:hypothetical protein
MAVARIVDTPDPMKQVVITRRLFTVARTTPPPGGSVDPAEYIEAGSELAPAEVIIAVPGLGPNDIVRDVTWCAWWLYDLHAFSKIEVERAGDQTIRLRAGAFATGAADVQICIIVYVHTGGPRTVARPELPFAGTFALEVTARGVRSPLEQHTVRYVTAGAPAGTRCELLKEQFDPGTNRWIARETAGVGNSGSVEQTLYGITQRTEMRHVLRAIDGSGERARIESQVFTVDPAEHFVSRRAVRVFTGNALAATGATTFRALGTRDAPSRSTCRLFEMPNDAIVVGAGLFPSSELGALRHFAYLAAMPIAPNVPSGRNVNVVAAPDANGGGYVLPITVLAIWRGPDAAPLGPMLLPSVWADEKELVTPPEGKPAPVPTGTTASALGESRYTLRRGRFPLDPKAEVSAWKRLGTAFAKLEGTSGAHRTHLLADVLAAAAESLAAMTPGAQGYEVALTVAADRQAGARLVKALRSAAQTEAGEISIPRLAASAGEVDLIARAVVTDDELAQQPWFDQVVVGGDADCCDKS